MKIYLIHNNYGIFSGEEAVVESLLQLLSANGHKVIPYCRSSIEIPKMKLGKIRAFFNGIYSFSSKNFIRREMKKHKPDIVHIHNLFPLISPSILGECRRADIPVVMTVHNYRLLCPNGLFMTDGKVCDKCSYGREYWCILCNCMNNKFVSIGYALRNYFARRFRLFKDNVTIYICLTEFQRNRLVAEGFPSERCTVIPNMLNTEIVNTNSVSNDYVGYIGRISPEKGVTTLLAAASKFSEIPFKVAGSYDLMPFLLKEAPSNFKFLGKLSGNEVKEFYRSSRFIVLCSIWFEGFPMVILEAMLMSKPVICSRIGGLPEIVEDCVTGLLFDPGNADDLAEKIYYLWEKPDLCRKMGQAGRKKVLREYSPERYYKRLMVVYEKAIELMVPTNRIIVHNKSQ